MGLAATVVLLCSNIVISALRKVIPDKVRIPCYIVLIAGFVTMVQMLVKAFAPALDAALGIYLPLIVVNCIILGRAEMFANKNKVFDSAVDALGMGAGFTLALSLMALIREVFGNGTFFGLPIPVLYDNHISILTMAPGGFFVFGLLIAAVNKFSAHKPKKQDFGCTGCPSAEICSHSCVNREEAAAND
jgi:electron transport complex protein RnfE